MFTFSATVNVTPFSIHTALTSALRIMHEMIESINSTDVHVYINQVHTTDEAECVFLTVCTHKKNVSLVYANHVSSVLGVVPVVVGDQF